MLVTGNTPPPAAHALSRGNMGFLKAPTHHKIPSPLSESLSERFSTIIDNCQKKMKIFQGPSTLFNHFVTKARKKDRECSSAHEHKLYLEEAVLERNIPETDLRQLVDLPPGLGYEEWLASHTIDFFHHVNLLYGSVCEFCTLAGCPDMTGPGPRHYLWFDEKGKKTRVAAPQYVDYVMTFTQNTVNDEAIFPTKFENDFPSSFESIVKKIHRLLFHVVAHLYHAHFREVVLLSLHSHLNCIFAHFVLFNEKFGLIDDKETEILHDLVVALKIHPPDESGGGIVSGSDTDPSRPQQDSPVPMTGVEGVSTPICIPPTSLEAPMTGSPTPGERSCFPGCPPSPTPSPSHSPTPSSPHPNLTDISSSLCSREENVAARHSGSSFTGPLPLTDAFP